jgi:tetratricopeptide (TPR) repeat protein
LQQRGAVNDILHGLILVAAVKTQPQMQKSSRPYRMLRVFLNHELLLRMLDSEQARNLYGSVEQALHWEPNFWLQRGSLEVEQGELRLAENFLGQARSLAPDYVYVENEWAYLLFKKAINAPGSSGAPDLVRDATEILMELIRSERGTGMYPYHVLGSQGLSWARRGIRHEEDRARYLRGLIATVQSGIKKIPEASALRQLDEDLRQELLSLAVPQHLRK